MRILPALLVLAVAGSALAQDTGDDWDTFVDAEAGSIMASVDFGNVVIAVRCQNGGLDAVLTGLPAGEGVDREILLKFADEAVASSTRWNVGIDRTIAVSERPAPFARKLRQGGRLDVVVPGAGEGGRNLRYALDLPSEHAVLDHALTACNKPLEDPRDAEVEALGEDGLPGGLIWAREPRATYPRGRVYERGFAVVSCIAKTDGGLRACEIETEHPRDGGFGAQALEATRQARLANAEHPDQPVPQRMVSFRASFVLEDEVETQFRSITASRLRPNPRAPRD